MFAKHVAVGTTPDVVGRHLVAIDAAGGFDDVAVSQVAVGGGVFGPKIDSVDFAVGQPQTAVVGVVGRFVRAAGSHRMVACQPQTGRRPQSVQDRFAAGIGDVDGDQSVAAADDQVAIGFDDGNDVGFAFGGERRLVERDAERKKRDQAVAGHTHAPW